MKIRQRALTLFSSPWLGRFLAVAICLLFSVPGWALPESEYEEGSGRMIAFPEGGEKPVVLPLKQTRVKAQIAGLVSTVVVTQEFENPYETPIEAVYVFPLPHHAAVYGMKMMIGDRIVEGIIKPRGEAQELYEQAKQQGKTASLLDQERPNIFTQSVANILPGDNILVELSYFQDLDYEKGQVEFVFPTVVGPRYIPGHASGRTGEGWSDDTTRVPDGSRISPPLLPPGTRSGHEIEIEVHMDTGVPFRDLETPSHSIQVDRHGPSRATVTLSRRDRIPNKDFVLRWKTNPEGPLAGWVTHHDDLGGYFLLMLEPEARIPRAETAPREYVFVVDTSGSMNGFPLDQCKRLIERCLKDLDERDSFQVILFAGGASTFAPAPVPATASNIRKAMEYVKAARGGGGTEFLPALEKALKHPLDRDRSRIVLFLSDGYIGYEAQVLKYMNENLESANLFPMGIGTSVNRYLIDAMGRIGKGKPFYLRPDENPDETVGKFFEYVSRPSVTGIEVDFEGLPVYDLWPEKVPDLFAGRPVTLVARFDRGARGKITLTGWLAGRRWEQTLEVELPDEEPANPGLPILWARKRIETLSDRLAIGEIQEEEAKERITELGLRYSLMSAYTSFVAIDSEVRNPGGQGRTVSVPIPLPDQVSPLAAPGHAYVTAKGMKYSASVATNGFLCRKQSVPPSNAGIGRDERAAFGSSADAALPAELKEEERKEDDAECGIREIRIRGTLNEKEVRTVLEAALEEWDDEGDLSDIRGPVMLTLIVDEDGKVASAWTRNKEALNEEDLRVLLEHALGLSFPGSETRSTIIIDLTF
jgi:Ca-activated chloride channel family protein